jgi:hypothetical protein
MGVGNVVTKILRGKTSPADLIEDWKWRPLEDVRADVGGVKEVPGYITDTYGKFMKEQAGRAAKDDLGARDLLKAYAITRSSVNRGARDVSDDLASGSARPEGYFSEWLLSPQGRRYLDAAQKGDVDQGSIDDIVQRFNTFGMADTLGSDLAWGARNLPQKAQRLGQAVAGPRDLWRSTAQDLQGIGPAKSGFIASLLGRGDMPTLDARQLKLQAGPAAADASKFMRRGGGKGGDAAVDRLGQRQTELGLGLPDEFSPHYQHLTHHTLWDKMGGTQTTHDDLVRAMQFGGATPGLLGATGGGAAATIYALRNGEKR